MSTINILGIDPSLNNTGLAVCAVDMDTFEIESIIHLHLAATEATKAKKQVRKNSDDLRRSQEIIKSIKKVIDKFDIKIAIAEIPTGTQSARGSISNGICIGVLGAVSILDVSLFQVLPNEVKMATVGDKKASKLEMFRWAYMKDISADWIFTKRKNDWHEVVWDMNTEENRIVHKSNEHLADAVAAVHAGIKSEPFQQAAAFMHH